MSYNIVYRANGIVVKLASKDYVDLRIQALKNALISHEQNISTAHTENSVTLIDNAGLLDKEESVELLPNEFQINNLSADNIEQDSSHRFLSDTQIQTFKNKPSVFDMQNAIEDAKSELKSTFNDLYIKLLNMPDAVDKLKLVAKFIESSDIMKTLLEEIGSRVTEEELNDHEKNNKHLTNNDRKALNLLLDYINNGFMQKIPDIGNHAKYANEAGNAAELNGYYASDLKKCHLEKLIYGLDSYDSITGVNELIDPDSFNGGNFLDELFYKNIKKEYGIIGFKSGYYRIRSIIDLDRDSTLPELIIRGVGNSTKISTYKAGFNNVSLEDLSIEGNSDNAAIEIHSNIKFKNVTFKNCHFTFKESDMVLINGCTFDNCAFKFESNCSRMIITNNFFNNGALPIYLSSSCSISNNVVI